jgi:hypothetical protein
MRDRRAAPDPLMERRHAADNHIHERGIIPLRARQVKTHTDLEAN